MAQKRAERLAPRSGRVGVITSSRPRSVCRSRLDRSIQGSGGDLTARPGTACIQRGQQLRARLVTFRRTSSVVVIRQSCLRFAARSRCVCSAADRKRRSVGAPSERDLEGRGVARPWTLRLTGPDVDVVARDHLIEVDNARDEQPHALLGTVRRVRPDDAVHPQNAVVRGSASRSQRHP